jgi:hypothetical protein
MEMVQQKEDWRRSSMFLNRRAVNTGILMKKCNI